MTPTGASMWEDYEEPPDRANMRRALAALTRPVTRNEAANEADQLLENEEEEANWLVVERRTAAASRRRKARLVSRPISPR